MYSFFHKLFPYKSIYHWDENTLTAWWVLITLVIAIFFLFQLMMVSINLRISVKKCLKNFSEDSIAKDKQLKKNWRDYSATFLDFNGGKKTDEFSYIFFNEKNLLASNTNLKLISSIPGVLVGIGILGTFVGLTYGITGFKTTSTEQIKVSIETLLSGMGTAFVSSIWGMGLSLVFTFSEKIMIKSLHNSIHQLCYELDKKYKISKEDERKVARETQEAILSDYFILIDDNGNRVKPKNVFRDIYNESVKQSKAMQSFSTDLALKIEAGFETILTNQIQNGIIPELQSLKTEIENLSKKLQNPAVEMTQNVVKDLESALNKMIEELKTSISGSTKSEFETLTTLIQQAGASFMEIPSRLQNMIGNLEEKFNGLQEIVQQTTKQTLTQSNESIEQMKKQVEDISDIFKTKFGDLQSGQENLVSKQSENLQISDRLLIAFNDSIEKMSGLTQNITTTISGFDSAQNNLNLATGQLMLIAENVNKSSNTFKDVQTNFLQQIKHFFEATFKTIQEIQKSLLNAKDVSTDYSQKFTIIQNGLQSIFGEIQRGLNDYRDTIGTSMEKYLGEYTAALKETAGSIAAATKEQREILEELTEQLSKLMERKN